MFSKMNYVKKAQHLELVNYCNLRNFPGSIVKLLSPLDDVSYCPVVLALKQTIAAPKQIERIRKVFAR